MTLTEYYFGDNSAELSSIQDLQTKVKFMFVKDKEGQSLTFDDILLANYFNMDIKSVASRKDLMEQFKEKLLTKEIHDLPFGDKSWELSLPIPDEWKTLATETINKMVQDKIITTFDVEYARGLSNSILYQKLLINNAVAALIANKKHVSALLQQVKNNPYLLLDPKLTQIDKEDVEEDNANLPSE